MRQKLLIFCVILVLLITGCAQQPEATTPAADTTSTEQPVIVVEAPTETVVETEAPAYPEPVTEGTLEETAYPAPDTGVVSSPYPNPVTDLSGVSPYPGPDQITDNNLSSPMNPIAGEESMTKGQVFLDTTEVTILESNPVQAGLLLIGSLPTPCHFLRVNMTAPDADKKIAIEVISLADPTGVCIQVLQPFETTVNLGSFAAGSYTIWVNGQLAGEYTQ